MRDSNYKSVQLNKAAVSITTNLYDRRALDCTTDQPLVNSLNHLTFLTSSSPKVRETLSTDGGLERLVAILHECHKEPTLFNQDINKPKTIQQEKQNALTAWKWTLAFQCLVLIGTRGTEQIRKRVAEAGIIPIIATVLDNYLLIVRNFDNDSDSNLAESFLTLISNKFKKKFKSTDKKTKQIDPDYDITNILNKDSKLYQFLQLEKKKTTTSTSALLSSLLTSTVTPEDTIDPKELEINEMAIQQNLHDINETITSPRFFLNGVLIPKDDDVVWSLQLLAFISKYSNLKDYLQLTHLVDPLSLRTMLEKCNEFEQEQELPILDCDLFMDNENDFELISNVSSDENRNFTTQNNSSIPTTAGASSSQSQHLEPTTQSSIGQSQSQSSSSILIQNNISNEQITDKKMQPQAERSRNLSPQLPNSKNPLSSNESSSLEDNDDEDDDDDDISSVNSMAGGAASTLPSTIASFTPKLIATSQHQQLLVNSNNQIFNENKISDLGLEDQGFNRSLRTTITNFEESLNDKDINKRCCILIELTIKMNKYYHNLNVCKRLKSIMSSKSTTSEFLNKWNYETYFQKLNQPSHRSYISSVSSSTRNSRQQSPDLITDDIVDEDIDLDAKITYPLNLFPLVEKFTVKATNTSDMCYWSGVIMRNSCRKDEERGGVRQCAYFQCGKWEARPKEFAKCRRCKRTKYCSKECQLKAWSYHKHWCVNSSASSANHSATTTAGSGAPTVSGTRNDEASPTQVNEIF